ncbi:sialic acid-binding Ig-like lectin 7 [Stegastes partitus]|uniref:Sialic acid-binding Ig-like lectin 7 n=1 Tax=Stegastes partitus TaxID=144197 RepID=A0A9Y4U2P9_9TELE|nr:PREDICTED: sialic acid-binding Ig-like lectin 7 [Stegastes partitus]
MEGLSGSCLQIPCSFTAKAGKEQFDSRKNIFGVWIKSDPQFANNVQNIVFSSGGLVNTYKMRITGNMTELNCTTLFSGLTTKQTGKYFFRIENEPFKATASCDPLQINIRDSPLSPRIDILGELKEKESVTISCSAFTLCPHSPPKLIWNLQQDSHNQIEENTDRTFTSKIQQTITLSDTHDGYNISCSATYPVDEGKHGKTAKTQRTLNVSYAPKETSASISPSDLVSTGTWVNLTCSSRANPPISSFTWFIKTTDGTMKSQTGEESVFEEPERKVEEDEEDKEEENIHYGEINFKQNREPSPDSVRDIQQQQDTVYAEVNKVNKSANNQTRTDDAPEEL